MKKITMFFEDADGQSDRLTGFHVDHGDGGDATWLASGACDGQTPAGSPLTIRQIGERLRDDVAALPREKAPVVVKPAPSPEAFIDASSAVAKP